MTFTGSQRDQVRDIGSPGDYNPQTGVVAINVILTGLTDWCQVIFTQLPRDNLDEEKYLVLS